jgi:hypothetical protein
MPSMPLFVASRSRIREMLPTLQLRREEEWQSVYVDPATSVEWIQYPLWDYHGPGPNCLRRGNPALEEVLTCIGTSEEDSEVSAAAYHLAHELPGTKENYEPLIERLESLFAAEPSARVARNVALAITWSGIETPFNHRSPMGKSIEQVNADYRYFAALAERSSSLKTRVQALLGCSITQKSTSFE